MRPVPGTSHDVAVFWGEGDFTGGNPDRLAEVWVADQSAPPRLEPDGPAPTALSWPPEPRSIRYDVIRGDVADLGPGSLGSVVCLEDDSPDADTLGFEDPEDPPTGQAFFYLFRGTEGLAVGPGSYGTASDGTERIAAGGDCTP